MNLNKFFKKCYTFTVSKLSEPYLKNCDYNYQQEKKLSIRINSTQESEKITMKSKKKQNERNKFYFFLNKIKEIFIDDKKEIPNTGKTDIYRKPSVGCTFMVPAHI